jgi:hypothetical protein
MQRFSADSADRKRKVEEQLGRDLEFVGIQQQ